MPGRIFNRSVKLELDTESDVYFLPPRQRTDPESGDTRETDDNAPSGSRTLLTGTATLTLTNSKHIDAVQVDLVRFYISGGLSAHELKDNLHQVARHMVMIDGIQHHYGICLGSYRIGIDEVLQPGRYSFPYAVAVPWNAAPSEQSSL